ncbi:MAG: ABC transporter substrate-binding protein [Chitinophagaceae bacterium]|nr:ABC transporter substrate-binding protein [Chitinophagaceae bacterium]
MVQAAVVFTIQLSSCKNHHHDTKKIFHYNEATGIATLDPAFSKNQSIIWAVNQLYNRLVETDSNLQVAPSLAKSWEVTTDRLTYTFHLRRDVFFHDNASFSTGKGRRMTANDVVYSLARIMDPEIASSGAWIFNNRIDSIEGFSALNDSTFRLKLRRPFNPVLGLLSMHYCSIVPREVVEKYRKDFRNHPCGTGPFQFKAWEEGQAMILVRNPNYFESDQSGNRLPYLDGIKISFYDNKATEFLLFRQGKLDFINDIDPSFKDELLSKSGNLKHEWKHKLMLSKHPYLNTEYLGILVDTSDPAVRRSPLANKKVRQAINYGFDRRKMMLYLRNSIGTSAESGFVPIGFPSFNANLVRGYYFDPIKAKRLLDESGYTASKDKPLIKLLTIATYADMASFIARELEEIGIKIQVEVIQKSLLLEQTAKSIAPFFRASWMADYPDAENYLSLFYSKNPAPPNYTRFSNREVDRMYEQALVEENDSVKFDLYRKIDQIVIEEAPVVPLWYDEVIRLVSPRLSGFNPNALNLLELRYAQKN